MASPKTATPLPADAVRSAGAGAPNANGGRLAAPWPKGVSGNPGGRPARKPITEAYDRILDLPAAALGKFTPKTQAEVVAWAMIRRAASMADKLGVSAAKEITDRVEGGVSSTTKHVGDDGQGPVRVRLEFTARGARTTVEQVPELTPASGNGHDADPAYPVGPEEEEG